MVRFTSALVVIGFLLTAAILAVVLGFAAPFITPSMLPFGPATLIVGAMLIPVIAGLFGGMITAGRWNMTGRQLGLTPNFGQKGLLKPALTGEIDGRTVRVYSYNSGGGAEAGTGRTYTHIEAELTRPLDWGAIVGLSDHELTELARAGGPIPDIAPTEEALGNVSQMGEGRMVAAQDGIVAWGDCSTACGEELLTPRLTNAIRASESGVAVGDATGTVVDALLSQLDDAESSAAGVAHRVLERAAGDRSGDPSMTVSCDKRGVILDTDELQSYIELVVAAGDAAERADTMA